MRQYLARKISSGKRTREGEMFYLPNVIKPGDVVWDIGANAGEYTFLLSRLVGPGHVHAFEPMSFSYANLQATIRRGRLTNVTTHQLAIADYCGTAHMAMPSVLNHTVARFSEDGEPVQVRSIDALIDSGLPCPTFIKVDVEGHGPAVIAGASRLIRDHRPNWLMEVWEKHSEIEHMERIGYECYWCPYPHNALIRVHERSGTASTYFFFPA